jgi:hypothetical protein
LATPLVAGTPAIVVTLAVPGAMTRMRFVVVSVT